MKTTLIKYVGMIHTINSDLFTPVAQSIGLYTTAGPKPTLTVAVTSNSAYTFNGVPQALIRRWSFVGPKKSSYNAIMTALRSAGIIAGEMPGYQTFVSGIDADHCPKLITIIDQVTKLLAAIVNSKVTVDTFSADEVFSNMIYSLDNTTDANSVNKFEIIDTGIYVNRP